MNHKLERQLLERLGGPKWGGARISPPGDHLEFRTGRYSGFVGDDGTVLNIGYQDSEQVDIALRAKDARSLAWFILWQWWAKGTWFGLRRRIWYSIFMRRMNREALGQ